MLAGSRVYSCSLSSRCAQLLVIGFSTFKLGRPMSRLNFIGVVMVVFGLVRYTFVSFSERRARKKLSLTGAILKPKGGELAESAMLLPMTVPVATPAKRARAIGAKGSVSRASFWSWLSGGKGGAESMSRSR